MNEEIQKGEKMVAAVLPDSLESTVTSVWMTDRELRLGKVKVTNLWWSFDAWDGGDESITWRGGGGSRPLIGPSIPAGSFTERRGTYRHTS